MLFSLKHFQTENFVSINKETHSSTQRPLRIIEISSHVLQMVSLLTPLASVLFGRNSQKLFWYFSVNLMDITCKIICVCGDAVFQKPVALARFDQL